MAKKNLNFIQGFKSAILPKVKNSQNGTFEPLHEIQNFFSQKILMKYYESEINKKIPENVPGSAKSTIKAKVQKVDFLKKTSQDLKNYFCFGFI